MSLNPVDGGGYTAYFQTNNVTYNLGPDVPPVEIEDSRGFAVKHMTLNRFRQIRGAFHPENKVAAAGGGDKCYQFRTLLNQLNETSRKTFFVPKDMAFDEGGVGCRSRMCPVRQFNKDKPQKFRVWTFSLWHLPPVMPYCILMSIKVLTQPTRISALVFIAFRLQ